MKSYLWIGYFVIIITYISLTFIYEDFAFKYQRELLLGKGEIGIPSLIFGIILFSYYIYVKSQEVRQHQICPNCKESYNYEELKNGLCPVCDVKTVDIEEYYKSKHSKQEVVETTKNQTDNLKVMKEKVKVKPILSFIVLVLTLYGIYKIDVVLTPAFLVLGLPIVILYIALMLMIFYF